MIEFRPIGHIRSPWKTVTGTPIQPNGARGVDGVLEIEPEFVAGLRDLDGFSHIIVLYHLHLVRKFELSIIPFLDNIAHGIFATRAPARPNPIGMSLYRLLSLDGGNVAVSDVDAIDGSPILDIKPYVPSFDATLSARVGWFGGRLKDAGTLRSDSRFE